LKFEKIPTDDLCSARFRPRVEVTLLCEVRQGTRPWAMARSTTLGERLPHCLAPGCSADLPLRIRIPGMRILQAEVRCRKAIRWAVLC